MPATAPVRTAIADIVSPLETMRSCASTAPRRTLGSRGSICTTEITSGPAAVCNRYVARSIPGATNSRSSDCAITSGNGAGGASTAGSDAAPPRAPQRTSSVATPVVIAPARRNATQVSATDPAMHVSRPLTAPAPATMVRMRVVTKAEIDTSTIAMSRKVIPTSIVMTCCSRCADIAFASAAARSKRLAFANAGPPAARSCAATVRNAFGSCATPALTSAS